MTVPSSGDGTGKLFSTGDLAAWLNDGDRAQPVARGARGHIFSAVTMSGLATGSPPMQPGGLFVAIQGRRDGHDFVSQALSNGAQAAVVSRVPDGLTGRVEAGQVKIWRRGDPSLSTSVPTLFLADDPMVTLQGCAAWWRRQHAARVLALTGSVGKTTTKDLLTAILSQRGPLISTRGNLNNELGLPFMLLELTREHRYAVVEIGISAIGEMEAFAAIAGPDVAIVTRVAAAHMEQFGDIDTVEREKGRLVEALNRAGVAILNADDPRVARMADRTTAKVVTYGEASDASVRAAEVELLGFQGLRFRLIRGGEDRLVTVPLIGRHFVASALAAAAAAFEEGSSWDDVAGGLERPIAARRLDPIALPNGVTLLDDTYNASPAAMQAALDVLRACRGRRITVLGDMFEMGNAGPPLHRDVGRYVPSTADMLVAVGELGREIASGALEAGMDAASVTWTATTEAATDFLRPRLSAGDYVLIKGSRGMHMDRIVTALAGEHLPAGHGAH